MRKKEEVFDLDKTKNLEVTDIYPLVEDMKKVKQDEWFPDIYCVGQILREYAGLPESYKVYGLIEHAPQLSNVIHGGFGIHESWASVVCGPYRVNIIENTPNNNGAYAIGPHIAYAKHAYSKEKLEEEKKRLGENLLVFPAHSTFGLDSSYDIKNFCEEINHIGENFDSIRVCLFWKDVLNGTAKNYEKEGYEVVTAGHFYDPLFLSRQKSIIETSTKTMSNHMGSYVGYSIFMNKPHYITPNANSDFVAVKDDGEALAERQYAMYKKVINLMDSDPEYKELLEAFSTNHDRITFKQKTLVNKYWGSNYVKTPREMKELLFMLDGQFNHKNQLFLKLINARDVVDKNKVSIGIQRQRVSDLRKKVNDLQGVVDKDKETISSQNRKINDLMGVVDKDKETISSQNRKINDLMGVVDKDKGIIRFQNKQINDLHHIANRCKKTNILQREKIDELTNKLALLKSPKYWIKYKFGK